MACVVSCSENAINLNKKANAYNAIIDEYRCINCNTCRIVCPRNTKDYLLVDPIEWYQGWAVDNNVRKESTSGGVASAIMGSFIDAGGYVCSCAFSAGEFCYFVTNSKDDIKMFSGSKYVKSDPADSFRKVLELLTDGEKVLFLGLPCHVAGLKKYVGNIGDNLYTVDLICHGTPSPILLESYLKCHGVDIFEILDISFRSKDEYSDTENTRTLVPRGAIDRYLYSFLKKVNLTDNCYNCQFASVKRISDLTLGDSWGSNLDYDEQKRGISLLLVQNEKGTELVNMAALKLFPVDLMIAVENNRQLQNSSEEPDERKRFFELFNKGVDYDKIMLKLFPKVFILQDIKALLVKLKLINGYNVYNISVKMKNSCR